MGQLMGYEISRAQVRLQLKYPQHFRPQCLMGKEKNWGIPMAFSPEKQLVIDIEPAFDNMGNSSCC